MIKEKKGDLMSGETEAPISNEEPELFKEKLEKKGIGKMKLALALIFSLAAFVSWPRGVIQGEAILQARSFAKMGLTSSGVLKELLHEKGEFVKGGELIARFENSELLKRKAQEGLRLEKLRESRALLHEKARFYEKESERKRILYENSAIGRAILEKAELDAASASEELIMLEKEIESAEKETEYLKSKADALELKAPFDGVLLTDPSDHVGSPIQEGEFVLEVADPATYFLELLVPEKDVEKIALGDRVKARFRAFPWEVYSGEVVRISPRTMAEIEKVFKVKHVVPCEIKLHETPRSLKYGMRARVKIQSKRKGVVSL